jgi:methionine synthase I (cobalamin-dependent)
LLLFETFSDVAELELAVHIAKRQTTLPIVACMSYGVDGLTLAGQSIASAIQRLGAAGVDVVGANCSVGPAQMVECLRAMGQAAPQSHLAVTPNAGLPAWDEEHRAHYPVGPSDFAAYVPTFVAQGARLVGGCCGTTPAFTAEMRKALDHLR